MLILRGQVSAMCSPGLCECSAPELCGIIRAVLGAHPCGVAHSGALKRSRRFLVNRGLTSITHYFHENKKGHTLWRGLFYLVELCGIEPQTSCVQGTALLSTKISALKQPN